MSLGGFGQFFSTTMKGFRTVFLMIIIMLFSLSTFLRVSDCLECRNNKYGGSKLAYTITVSKSSGGNFTKVQDAVNTIPSGNDQWIRIYVESGTYWEQVKLWYDQGCVLLEGHSREDTIIAYDAHASTDTSSTFVSSPDNFVAKNITFMNSYNFENDEKNLDGKLVKQAVAMTVYGDKSAFYNCAFIGYQDTLWDVQGRHFFKDSYIEGAIDFIWGDGQSIYEDCSINIIGFGYVTAQGRKSANDRGGFVFIRGSVFGNGNAFLGRAYGPYSRVVFQQTLLSNVVSPLGWDPWKYVGHEIDLTYAEINCTGEGANTSQRVEWEKKLSASEASKYTTEVFFDHDNWISQLP